MFSCHRRESLVVIVCFSVVNIVIHNLHVNDNEVIDAGLITIEFE